MEDDIRDEDTNARDGGNASFRVLWGILMKLNRGLQRTVSCGNEQGMSMAEIIDELPKLTHHQRRELCQKIIELEAHGDDIALADDAARQGFAMLDEMEAHDAARGQ